LSALNLAMSPAARAAPVGTPGVGGDLPRLGHIVSGLAVP